MKLSSQDVVNLNNILSTCSIAGIEALIIEDGVARGVNESKTCAIISNFNIPAMPQKIGLSRLSSLRQRLDLFSGTAAVIEAKESERGEVSMLEIAAGRNKVQFRCTSTMLIKAPKVINATPSVRVFITKDELKMVLNAIKVMGGKKVQLTIKKDRTVSIHLNDATNDVFSTVLENPVERLGEDMDSIVHYYAVDIFSAVMRSKLEEGDTISFDVGDVGTIHSTVLGHQVTMLPQINEDAEE